MQDTRIDNFTAADRLIAAHDGDVALLYIYRKRTGCRDLEQAARDLCRTMQEVRAAQEKLQRIGLWEDSAEAESAASVPTAGQEAPHYLPPADELPQYTAQEISRMAVNPDFTAIRKEAERIKGKQLTTNELGILAGIFNHLALPADVILLLLNYCQDKAEAQRPGSRPGFRMIQQEAFHWANLEILTFEQAEEYIRRQRERGSKVGRVQSALGLQGRPLTLPERKHIDAWLDMGFAEDAIALAYERTVYNTGSFKWPYINAILKRWHAAGLHDRRAVEEKEGARQAAKAPAAKTEGGPIDLDRLKDFLNKM